MAHLTVPYHVPTQFTAMRSPLETGEKKSLPQPNVLAGTRTVKVTT